MQFFPQLQTCINNCFLLLPLLFNVYLIHSANVNGTENTASFRLLRMHCRKSLSKLSTYVYHRYSQMVVTCGLHITQQEKCFQFNKYDASAFPKLYCSAIHIEISVFATHLIRMHYQAGEFLILLCGGLSRLSAYPMVSFDPETFDHVGSQTA